MEASALAFGRMLAERPTPSAITLNAIDEDIKHAASILLIFVIPKAVLSDSL
jgi:hypothetical protein